MIRMLRHVIPRAYHPSLCFAVYAYIILLVPIRFLDP